jgi:phage pi2 protein 07
MDNKDSKQIMVGMVNAGKTTYLAALFHVAETAEVPGSLQLVKLEENREYVINKRNEWLGCKPFERTKVGKEQLIRMVLKHPDSSEEINLSVPDLSGETFRDQWELRRTTKLADDLLQSADGILLFLHPATTNRSTQINEMLAVASVLDGVLDEEATSQDLPDAIDQPITSDQVTTTIIDKSNGTEPSQKPEKWHASTASMQVKTVEILQFLLREPELYRFSRVAVVISAWDLCKERYSTPSQWLLARMPLLSQFLTANEDRLAFKLFGISAQGGQHGKDEATMHAVSLPSERIQIVTDRPNEFGLHDITAPLKWLIDQGSSQNAS